MPNNVKAQAYWDEWRRMHVYPLNVAEQAETDRRDAERRQCAEALAADCAALVAATGFADAGFDFAYQRPFNPGVLVRRITRSAREYQVAAATKGKS